LSILKKAHILHSKSIEYNLNSFFGLLERIEFQRYEDTLVFLISDHGDAFGERHHIMSFRKFARERIVSHDTLPIQEIIRIPFILKFPKSWGGKYNMQKVITTNSILPTILDVLGLKPQISLFEKSLLNQDVSDPWRVLCEHWWGESPYVALVDQQNGYQFIGSSDQDQSMNGNFFSLVKNRLKDFIGSKYGILGVKAIGDQGTPKPDVTGIKRALESYLRRCGNYKFKHCKVNIAANQKDEEEISRRLRGLGYLE
ncbi:sulfatase-like hydrolase/transferase, partial [bacterium]|nr:sulfatase-like hydrolase/transferase [bacterium]